MHDHQSDEERQPRVSDAPPRGDLRDELDALRKEIRQLTARLAETDKHCTVIYNNYVYMQSGPVGPKRPIQPPDASDLA